MEEKAKVRYSDEELQEFKTLILEKLEVARKEYDQLKGIVNHSTTQVMTAAVMRTELRRMWSAR